ncbi:DUF695 domain-containing protein [Arthrobacter sp. ISL-65]|uniref:DUF695 domain-containing protein n=1 Tax=Arthrobacter sp. ISL-65 TaxID=2819112 RepID=UPI001BEB702B|nr:DUF695 domain-containing protein [Arthrobacter sp. ISL-65]MBT2548057.1 DUF695 domain-containing protein [Arthrobacter sp. ISL-65]
MSSEQRRNNRAEMAAVSAFWHWWSAEGATALTAAVTTGNYGDLPDTIGAMVKAIHPGLSWETGQGIRSRHQLCVSGAGDPVLRVLAERWRRAGPAPTPMWEFTAARQRQPGMLAVTLEVPGQWVNLGLARVSVTLDEDRALAKTRVYHPAFTHLSPAYRHQVSCLLLDWLLGEDDVQRWIGTITAAGTEPSDSLPASDLPGIIDAMASRHAYPGWILQEAGTDPGPRSVVSALRPARWIDHPLLDLHTAIRVSYPRTRNDGQPDHDALTDLHRLEEDLTAALGPRGMLVATETSNGRRILHYYTDSEDQNGRDTIDRFTGTWPDVEVVHTDDPGWTLINSFA